MFTSITATDLIGCLESIEPVALLGLDLLRESRPATGAWFPQLPLDVLTEATKQIIAYTKDCAAAIRKLEILPPMILTTRCCMEFCL